jgi:hypothetical protein
MRCVDTNSVSAVNSVRVGERVGVGVQCGGATHPIPSLPCLHTPYFTIPSIHIPSQPIHSHPPHPTIPLSRPASHSPHPHRLGRLPCLPVPYQYQTPLHCAVLHAHRTYVYTDGASRLCHARLHVGRYIRCSGCSVQRDITSRLKINTSRY